MPNSYTTEHHSQVWSTPAPHSRGYMPKSQSRDWLSKLRTLWFSSVPSVQMPGDTSSKATTVSVHIPSNSSFNDHHIIQGYIPY